MKDSHDSNNQSSIQELAKTATAIIVLFAILLIASQVFIGLFRDYIIIDNFEVASNLANDGYTGKTVVNKIIATIDEIRDNSIIVDNSIVVSTSTNAVPDIVIPGPQNTIKSMIYNIKEYFNKPMYVISGSIVSVDDKYKLFMRITGRKKVNISTKYEDIIDNKKNIDNIINDAAMKIMTQVDPITVSGYYYNNYKYDDVIKLAKSIDMNNKYQPIIFYIIGLSYYQKKQYKAVTDNLNNIKIAFASEHARYNIYDLWARALRKQNKYDESISMFKNTINIKRDEPYSYIMLANLYVLKSDYVESANQIKLALTKVKDVKKNKEKIIVLENLIKTFTTNDSLHLDALKDRWNNLLMTNLIFNS